MAPTYAGPTSEATLADVGRAVVRHWRWVVLPTLLAFAGSLAFVMLVTPRYTGESRLLLQTSDTYFTRPGNERDQQQAPQIDEQAVASQVQVVMSRDLAREAIKRLDLVGNPEFDPEAAGVGPLRRIAIALGFAKDPAERPPEDRVMEKYFDNLVVYPVGKSRIVAIEFRSRDADLAARGANTIAELYLGLQDDSKKDQARSASTWLGTNIDGLRRRVAEAEARVEAFRAKTGLLVGTGTTTISAQQLSELSTQLAQARSARSEAEAKAKLIRETIRSGRAFDIPDVANNELIRRLLEQRINLKAQLALELRTLLPAHPRIKELNAQLSDLEAQIRVAAERTVRSLENEARIAGARVEAIEASIEAQKKVVAQANENEVQLRALEREARTQREQLETYLARYREATARDTESGAPPDARIVSRAVSPQTPSFPKKLPIVALSTFAMLMLSLGAIVSRELLTGRPSGSVDYPVFETEPAEERRFAPSRPREFDLDLSEVRQGPVLGGHPVPDLEDPNAGEPDPAYDFGQLIERLSRKETEGRGRRVLVCGVAEDADARRVARGLALTLARRSRVILVESDGDETHPVDAILGLTDLVAGEASFAEVIRREAGTRLHHVATGTLMNEALTDATDGMDIAFEAFDSTYDWTICLMLGGTGGGLLPAFAPRVDAVVIASDMEPANPDLVDSYERAQTAGARDIVVAREHAAGAFEQAA